MKQLKEKLWNIIISGSHWILKKELGTDVKKAAQQALPFWIASAISGIVAVLYTLVFAYVEKQSIHLTSGTPWLIFILSPVMFLLSWLLVQKFARYSGGSGIPQLMASIELAKPRSTEKVNRLLSLRIIFVKITSSILLLFGGGAIGREGPTIQVSASIFQFIHNRLPSWWVPISKRIMLVTGGAAGLAAAFNTPLGGIVFVVEELTRTHIVYFRTAIFTAVIIAGMTAQWMLGPYLYLGYPDIYIHGLSFIFPTIVVSGLAGFAGALFSKIASWLSSLRTKSESRFKQALFITVIALLFATLVYYTRGVAMGSGRLLMENLLFKSKVQAWYSFPARFIGPLLSYSSGGAGGIFAPSLSAGASLGAAVADVFHLPTEAFNLLILAGMVGFLTGVTRTPFTASILVLEMTDRHSAIFFLMLAGMIASLVAGMVDSKSFYERITEQLLEENEA